MSNTQIAVTQPQKPSALSVMASKYNVEPAKLLATLKDTVFKGASESELVALVIVANEYGLNPLTKQIYAFPGKGGGITPIVSIDGWLRVINEHPQMDGVEFDFDHSETGDLVSCTCKIWRKDRNRPIQITEYLAETKRNTEPWKMEHRMLRHKTLIQCGRVAFGLSGIFDEDEADRIHAANVRVIESKPTPNFLRPQLEAMPCAVTEVEPEPVKGPDLPIDDLPQSAQQRLAQSLADCGISEEKAIAWLKKQGAKTTAKRVVDLEDALASDAVKNFAMLQGALL